LEKSIIYVSFTKDVVLSSQFRNQSIKLEFATNQGNFQVDG